MVAPKCRCLTCASCRARADGPRRGRGEERGGEGWGARLGRGRGVCCKHARASKRAAPRRNAARPPFIFTSNRFGPPPPPGRQHTRRRPVQGGVRPLVLGGCQQRPYDGRTLTSIAWPGPTRLQTGVGLRYQGSPLVVQVFDFIRVAHAVGAGAGIGRAGAGARRPP